MPAATIMTVWTLTANGYLQTGIASRVTVPQTERLPVSTPHSNALDPRHSSGHVFGTHPDMDGRTIAVLAEVEPFNRGNGYGGDKCGQCHLQLCRLREDRAEQPVTGLSSFLAGWHLAGSPDLLTPSLVAQ